MSKPPPPHFAICYWGMTRSTRHVYQTHFKHVFDILKQNGATFDIYMHTWKSNNNFIWNDECPIEHDYTEHQLLNPDFYKIDDQDEFLKTVSMDDYFYANEMDEWWPELVRNHICALESQKRCVNLMLSSNRNYDYVMFLRPDARFTMDLPYKTVFAEELNWCEIVVPDDKEYQGCNDQFAIVKFEHVLPYSHRLNQMALYRSNVGFITSEKYTKYIVDTYYSVKKIHFPFELIRPGGIAN
jgi:hypothetical protein